MSLMRLLSVSRSFCSNVPEMGRYKLSRRGALPDFRRSGEVGAVGRRATQVELPMEEGRRGGEEFRLGRPALGQPQLRQTTFGATEPAPDSGRSSSITTPARSSLENEAKPERIGRFKQALGQWIQGWSAWMRSRSRRRPKRLPVQTAFLLETVRVVRNDLTEADTELVVLKAKRGKVEAGGKVTEQENGRPLSRIAAKLFASGRSR